MNIHTERDEMSNMFVCVRQENNVKSMCVCDSGSSSNKHVTQKEHILPWGLRDGVM